MMGMEIQTKTQKPATDNELIQDFLASHKVPGHKLYVCSNLSVFNTEYKVGQFIVLPGSNNISPSFGVIKQLMCCEKYGYLAYQQTSSTYCDRTDLFFITEEKQQCILPAHQLSIGNFRPLEGYRVGEAQQMSVS